MESMNWMDSIRRAAPRTGQPVNDQSALSYAAVYACVDLLADIISCFPIDRYRQNPEGRPGAKKVVSPPNNVIDDPSADLDPVNWRRLLMVMWLLRGYAPGIVTDIDKRSFQPRNIELIHPDRVSFRRIREDAPWEYMLDGQPMKLWPRGRLWIANGKMMSPDDPVGRSILEFAAADIGLGLSARKFGRDFFDSGGHPTGLLRNDKPMKDINEEGAKHIKQRFMDALSGSREPVVMPDGWNYERIQIRPEESQFLATINANRLMIANFFRVPPQLIGASMQESGGNMVYNNAADRGLDLLKFCVDAETEILTQRGWLKYSEVTTNDQCLTLNPDTHLAEWQPVDGVHIFDDGPHDVLEMNTNGHSSMTTPNHRWLVQTLWGVWKWKVTEDLTQSDKILSAAPVSNLPTEPKYSDALVELLAWYYTEGHSNIRNGVRGDTAYASIGQHPEINPDNCQRIESCLIELFGPSRHKGDPHNQVGWSCSTNSNDGCNHYLLTREATKLLTEISPDKEKVIPASFLTQLTRSQLELFVSVSMLGDGSVASRGQETFHQSSRKRSDVFQLACLLLGRSGSVHSGRDHGMTIYKSPWRTPNYNDHIRVSKTTDLVWCPRTENKTWMARRGGTTYFTGNTVQPWVTRTETVLSPLTVRPEEVKLNVDSLLRADTRRRYDAHSIAVRTGFMSNNEVREIEDLEPVEGMDQYLWPPNRANLSLEEMAGDPDQGENLPVTPPTILPVPTPPDEVTFVPEDDGDLDDEDDDEDDD